MTDLTAATRPLALVTGASSGIGFELARVFAENGYDLVLNAENDGLGSAAAELRSGAGLVETVQADLRSADGVAQVLAAVQATGRPLAAAALNAGVGQGGAFVDNELADELEVIDLNVTSTVRLAHAVLRQMVAEGEGRVLITSSIASTMPGTYQSVYNASKSFLQSFAEAVAEELEDSGVTVTSLMPGPTDTNFFHRAEMDDTKMGQGPKDSPAQVAQQGFDALLAGKGKRVGGGLKRRTQAAANTVLPDALKAEAHGKLAEPGSGD